MPKKFRIEFLSRYWVFSVSCGRFGDGPFRFYLGKNR